MLNETFQKELANLLGLEVSEIKPDFKLDNDVLDSVAVMELMALIDEQYGVKTSGDELDQCKSIQELMMLIDTKVAS